MTCAGSLSQTAKLSEVDAVLLSMRYRSVRYRRPP